MDLALKKGYSKVMLGDCSTRLAVRLLTDIAQGRGAHVAMDTVRQKSISVNIHVDLNYFTLSVIVLLLKNSPCVLLPNLFEIGCSTRKIH